MDQVPVYILAGGRSSRFGSDKARAMLGGRPLVVRVARAVGAVASRVTVVADREGKYADLGLRTIADVRPGLGPIGGLETALRDARETLNVQCSTSNVQRSTSNVQRSTVRWEGWVLVVSCDLLELKREWVEELMIPGSAALRRGVGAVAFRHERWEPLPGLYHSDLLPLVEAQIVCGEGALWRLLERAGAVGVPLPKDWPEVIQANTPADLARAEKDE